MPRDNPWMVVNRWHDEQTLGRYSAVYTISNGYMGLGGQVQEHRSTRSPVTLIAGVFDELEVDRVNPRRVHSDDNLVDDEVRHREYRADDAGGMRRYVRQSQHSRYRPDPLTERVTRVGDEVFAEFF